MTAEQRIQVEDSTVNRSALKVLPVLEKAFHRYKRPVGKSRVDESFIKVNSHWTYLYCAVDRTGNIIDLLLRAHRNKPARR